MRTRELRTYDLYLAAFLVARGEQLVRVDAERNGRHRAAFVFGHNAQAQSLQTAYVAGDAEANVLRLKNALQQLKDELFDALDDRRRDHGTHRSS